MLLLLMSPPAQVAPVPVVELPFTLEGFLIAVEGKINGKPAKLILDTGAGVGLFTPKSAAKLELKPQGKAMIGGGGEKLVPAEFTTVQELSLGGAVQKNQLGVILDLPSGAKSNFDGIVGFPFLKNYVVQLDYAAKKVRFLTPEQFSPDPKATVLPMTLRMNIPEVPGQIDGVSGNVRVDTGFSGTLTFTSPTVTKNALEQKYPKQVPNVLGQGVGGATRGQMVRVNQLQLGDIRVPGIVTGLSTDKSGALADTGTIALLGGEVLSHFTVTLDYPGKRFFLSKNADFDKPFVFARTGFSGIIEGEGYKVLVVVPGGPAAEVGLKEGEIVLRMDGTAPKDLGLTGLRELFRRPVGTKLPLTVRAADGQTRTLSVTLRDLL